MQELELLAEGREVHSHLHKQGIHPPLAFAINRELNKSAYVPSLPYHWGIGLQTTYSNRTRPFRHRFYKRGDDVTHQVFQPSISHGSSTCAPQRGRGGKESIVKVFSKRKSISRETTQDSQSQISHGVRLKLVLHWGGVSRGEQRGSLLYLTSPRALLRYIAKSCESRWIARRAKMSCRMKAPGLV